MRIGDMRQEVYIESLKSRLKVVSMSADSIDSMVKQLGNTENEGKIEEIRDVLMDLKMFLQEKV